MTIEKDVWTDSQVTMFKEYSLGNHDIVKQMIAADPNIAFSLVENFMCDKLSNSLMRERIVAKNSNIRHSFQMHDYDGFDVNLSRPVEIKNEQHTTGGRRDQIVGGAAFSGIEDLDQIQRLINDNPIIYLSGWLDGKLAYTLRFDFNHTTIANRLTKAVMSRKTEQKKTAPKFLRSDWCNAESLTVTYLDLPSFNSLEKLISFPLWAKILVTYEDAQSAKNAESLSVK